MAVRRVEIIVPIGTEKEEADKKYTSAEISQHLTGVNQRLLKRIRAIEQMEAKSWADARNRIVGR